MIELPDWLTSTLASDATGGEGAMDGPLPARNGDLPRCFSTTPSAEQLHAPFTHC